MIKSVRAVDVCITRNSFTKYHHLNFGLRLFVIRRALSYMGVYSLIYAEMCR